MHTGRHQEAYDLVLDQEQQGAELPIDLQVHS